jgi:hypothetical protein
MAASSRRRLASRCDICAKSARRGILQGVGGGGGGRTYIGGEAISADIALIAVLWLSGIRRQLSGGGYIWLAYGESGSAEETHRRSKPSNGW